MRAPVQRSLIPGVRTPARKPREMAVHAPVWALYDRFRMPGTWGCHIPNGEFRKKVQGRDGRWYSPDGQKLKRMGQQNGVADLLFLKINPAGGPPFVYWLEMKRPGDKNRTSEDQDQFRDVVRALGCEYRVADTIDEGIRALQEWGLVRTSLQ